MPSHKQVHFCMTFLHQLYLAGEPCQVKIARIKEILQQVTKELTAEKQTLSSWKVSMSQSKLENNLIEDSIKERANKLMLHQKRLLSAFQRQKSISDVLRDKKYEESQVNRYFD